MILTIELLILIIMIINNSFIFSDGQVKLQQTVLFSWNQWNGTFFFFFLNFSFSSSSLCLSLEVNCESGDLLNCTQRPAHLESLTGRPTSSAADTVMTSSLLIFFFSYTKMTLSLTNENKSLLTESISRPRTTGRLNQLLTWFHC